jgi:hypothetical protein
MKVTEFLQQERTRVDEEEQQARAGAPDAYTGTVAAFPAVCRRQFLDWLGDGSDIPHDVFASILRRVAGHNEVHDRLGISPSYASALLERWQADHAHE